MSKDAPPSRTADQFVVRLPEGMRDRIAEAAKLNGRSMNSEIVARLSFSFQSSIKPPEGPNEEDWNEVRRLSRKRDDLTATLTMLNTLSMQLDYELRSAHVDDTSGDAITHLQQQIRSNRVDAYRVREELDKVNIALNAAYSKVEGWQPTGVVKMTKSDD